MLLRYPIVVILAILLTLDVTHETLFVELDFLESECVDDIDDSGGGLIWLFVIILSYKTSD